MATLELKSNLPHAAEQQQQQQQQQQTAKKVNTYPTEITFLPFTNTTTDEELRLKVTKTVSLLSGDVEAKRKEVLDYFHNTYTLYERLFEPLSLPAFYRRADPLRHPLIFYYGHTAVLYINKLRLAKLIKAR